MNNDLQKKLDELVKNSDYIVATPDTIEKMQQKGLPIKSTFQTYENYLDKLFDKKRKIASEVISQLPLLDAQIANATVQSLYDEVRECFVLGIPGAAITLSIVLFEYACRYSLYKEKLKSNPKTSWNKLEGMTLGKTIGELKNVGALNEDEYDELTAFNKKIRNNYLHYNIGKLVKEMVLKELPSIKIETGNVTVEKNVLVKDRPEFWFSAKRVLDRDQIIPIARFCIDWTNKLLK